MKLQEAKVIADDIIFYHLQKHCEIIHIAGSIRREVADVGDIEIVCLPKETETKDLFGEKDGFIRDDNFIRQVNLINGVVLEGNARGKYMKIELPQGINLDLFMPEKHDFYRILAIRTGSKNYSQHTIAAGWRDIGWCGSDKGLRKISDCEQIKYQNGKNEWRTKWVCINPEAELPPSWESEKDFFKWLHVPYIEPKYRMGTYIKF